MTYLSGNTLDMTYLSGKKPVGNIGLWTVYVVKSSGRSKKKNGPFVNMRKALCLKEELRSIRNMSKSLLQDCEKKSNPFSVPNTIRPEVIYEMFHILN